MPDAIHQCASCGILFRGSSMDSTQRAIAERTGQLYCSMDAYVIWLEARALVQRAIARAALTAQEADALSGCEHEWVTLWGVATTRRRCQKCGAMQEIV